MDIVIGYFSNKELLWDTVEDKVSYGRDVDISMDIRERILAEVNNGVLCGFLLFSPNYDVIWKLDSSDINTKALLNCIKYLSMEEFLIKYGNKGLLPGKVVNYFHTDGSYPRRNFKGNMCSLNYKSSVVQRHFEVCTDTCVSSVIDWLKDNGFLCGMNIIVEDVTVVVYMYKSFMVFMQYNTLSDIVDKCVGSIFYTCIRDYGTSNSTLVGLRGMFCTFNAVKGLLADKPSYAYTSEFTMIRTFFPAQMKEGLFELDKQEIHLGYLLFFERCVYYFSSELYNLLTDVISVKEYLFTEKSALINSLDTCRKFVNSINIRQVV